MVSLNFFLSLRPSNCRISWQRKSTARKKNMFPPYLIKTQLTRWMASTESKLSLNGSTHKREISPPPFSQFLTHCVCVSAWVRECLSGWVWVRVWVRVSVTEKERENHFVLTVDRRNGGPRPNAKSNIWTCVCTQKNAYLIIKKVGWERNCCRQEFQRLTSLIGEQCQNYSMFKNWHNEDSNWNTWYQWLRLYLRSK